MTAAIKNTSSGKWLSLAFAAALLISFFLPWVCWKDIPVKGYYMATGKFFDISGNEFSMSNPFPKLSFTFYILWLIPLLSALIIFLILRNKKIVLPALIVSVMSLGLLSIFFLFTHKDLAVETNVFKVLQPAGYLVLLSAVGLILTITAPLPLYKKAGALLAGPLFAFISHMLIENKFMSETHDDTDNVKADYTVSASELLTEFAANDSTANKKYREKIVSVTGIPSQVEVKTDSTVNVKFIGKTNHYIIFPLDKSLFERSKNLTIDQSVSLKGSCSGSSYSMILDSTSIEFKRTTFNKQ